MLIEIDFVKMHNRSHSVENDLPKYLTDQPQHHKQAAPKVRNAANKSPCEFGKKSASLSEMLCLLKSLHF